MYGNGVETGPIKIITAIVRVQIREDRVVAFIVFCVAVAGTTQRRFAEWLIAATAPRVPALSLAVFGWSFPSKQVGLSFPSLLISGFRFAKKEGRPTKGKMECCLIDNRRLD